MLEIRSGNVIATIDPKGGYVVSLRDKQGDILFPRKIFTDPTTGTQKVRGGSHVCLPNFGPGGSSDLPQHGYGRVSNWRPVFEDVSDVFLVLDTGPGVYRRVRTELHYELTEHSLEMALLVYNYGDTVVRFAPAFHPYFALGGSLSVELDGQHLPLGDLADTRFTNGETHILEINGRALTLESSELRRWALWTDSLDAYVCVEPTLDGNAFLDPVDDNQLIRGGVTRIYSFTLSW